MNPAALTTVRRNESRTSSARDARRVTRRPAQSAHAQQRLAHAAGTGAGSRMLETLEPRCLMHAGHDLPPAGDPAAPTLPHADNPTLQSEHLSLLNLVPQAGATHVAATSGFWSDAATWRDGLVPDADAHVLVSSGVTLTVDFVNTTPLHWLRADGTLRFAPDRDTGLVIDTIIVAPGGGFEMGTADAPIAAGAMAKVIFAGGEIDTTWDPKLLSKGLVSHGSVSIFGSKVTSFVPLTGDALKGTTTLDLTFDPTGWKAGDRLILTGTQHWNADDDEQLSILGIDGRRVTVEALKFDHVVTKDSGGGIYLANVSRNAVLESQAPQHVSQRGHVMFMHSDQVQVDSAGFYGLGRTDKRNAFDDPKLDEQGNFDPRYGTNPRGRYAVHFHRTGLAKPEQPSTIRGSAVVDSPGWGFVNHSSNVVMEDNVAYDVIGAAYATEAGDEIGAFRRNLAVKGTGSGAGLESREDVQDFGHQGDGFWFQGGGVEVVGNVAVGQKHAGFIYFTQGLEEAGLGTAKFRASNLADPSIAGGQEFISVADVPIRRFDGNQAFANGVGFETWFHMLNAKHGAKSVVDGFVTWNNGGGKAVHTPYTNNLVVRNSVITGNAKKPSGTGLARNDVTKNITYENLRVTGFKVGVDVARNGTNFVTGGFYSNITNVLVTTANDRGRVVEIGGGVVFQSPDAAALEAAGAAAYYEIALQSNFDPKHQDITRLFNPDVVKLGTVRYNGVQLYYNEQAADFVPFVKGEAASYVPTCLVGKTNQQLWDKFGLSVGGTVAPRDAIVDPKINALIGAPATYLPELKLASAKYTNNVTGYVLSYKDAAGARVTEVKPTKLKEGWNVVVRKLGGVNRSFLVYGDTITPTFELAANQSLVLNPADLKTGFTLKGDVVDGSFGRMNFKKKFKDLDLLPLQTDADGVTKFIVLTFQVKDFARNTMTVQLKVIVDPNAVLQKDIGRKVFGEKKISATLVSLLGFRDRDAA